MLPRASLSLMLALAVAACQGPKQPLTTATKAATPAPTASHGATPAADGAPRHLQKPKAGSRTIAGTLTLDAGYMATVGAGRAVAGGYAVADASLVANNAGNIISEHGGGLISNNGGTLISDNGGGIVANNGGNLISNNGSGLTGKTKLSLLADAAPGLGQELPIAGMWVGVISLKDGTAVPLGVDEAGKPVYVVHSDAKGHYELYLPPDLKDTVRIVAAVPDNPDMRLNYNLLVAPAKSQDEQFDEESALTSDFVRRVLTSELVNLGTPTADGVEADTLLAGAPPGLADLIRLGLQPFVDELERPEVRALSVERRHRAMQHAIDVFLATVDTSAMLTVPSVEKDPNPPELAMPALTRLFGSMHAKAKERLAEDPAYFAQRPYVLEANMRRAAAGLPAIAIRRPSDVGRFLVEEYARGGEHNRKNNGWVAAVDLGLPASTQDRFHLVCESLFIGLSQQLIEDEAVRNRLVDAEKAALAAELAGPPPSPEPAASPPLAAVAEGAYELQTLYTGGENIRGLAVGPDGTLYFSHGEKVQQMDPKAAKPAAVDVATLGQPGAMAVEGGKLYVVDQRDRKIHQAAGSGFGPASAQGLDAMAGDGHGGLIVADGEGERIWRVAVADGAVTELVGAPRADGLTPADATDDGALRRPRGLAVAPTGEIYVAENTHPRIWQLAADGRPTLLAGSGEGAVFDGYFIGASFKDPLGMAVAPDGSLLVADQDGDRLRRVRHQAGAGMVTSLDVAVQHPRLVAIGPDGTIYVVLNQDPSIRVLRPRN